MRRVRCQQHSTAWCKHIFAALIVKRATSLVKQKMEASEGKSMPVQEGTPESTAAPRRLGEASASCTLTFTLSGVDVMVTLHGTSEQALFPRIRHALIWVKGLGVCMTEENLGDDNHGIAPYKHKQNDQGE
jgi:hypothetical protein